MTNEELIKELEETKAEVASLRAQVNQIAGNTSDTSLPKTAILSHSFLKRAFAIYGHMFVAGLFIAIPIYVIAFIAATSG